METTRTDNVDEDKLSDTDEQEPFVEPCESQISKEKLLSLPGWKTSIIKKIILITKLQENMLQNVFHLPDVNEIKLCFPLFMLLS